MPKLSYALRAENRTKIVVACIMASGTAFAAIGKLNASRPRVHYHKSNPTTARATALCEDGTLSYASGHTGACSNHGGVQEWLR